MGGKHGKKGLGDMAWVIADDGLDFWSTAIGAECRRS
jgi:hypothetical protein